MQIKITAIFCSLRTFSLITHAPLKLLACLRQIISTSTTDSRLCRSQCGSQRQVAKVALTLPSVATIAENCLLIPRLLQRPPLLLRWRYGQYYYYGIQLWKLACTHTCVNWPRSPNSGKHVASLFPLRTFCFISSNPRNSKRQGLG